MASSDSCARKSDRSAVRIRPGELFRRGKRRLGAMRIPKCELPRSIQLRWSTAKSRAFSVTTARRSAVATSRTFSSLSGRGHERSLIALTSWPSPRRISAIRRLCCSSSSSLNDGAPRPADASARPRPARRALHSHESSHRSRIDGPRSKRERPAPRTLAG